MINQTKLQKLNTRLAEIDEELNLLSHAPAGDDEVERNFRNLITEYENLKKRIADYKAGRLIDCNPSLKGAAPKKKIYKGTHKVNPVNSGHIGRPISGRASRDTYYFQVTPTGDDSFKFRVRHDYNVEVFDSIEPIRNIGMNIPKIWENIYNGIYEFKIQFIRGRILERRRDHAIYATCTRNGMTKKCFTYSALSKFSGRARYTIENMAKGKDKFTLKGIEFNIIKKDL